MHTLKYVDNLCTITYIQQWIQYQTIMSTRNIHVNENKPGPYVDKLPYQCTKNTLKPKKNARHVFHEQVHKKKLSEIKHL